MSSLTKDYVVTIPTLRLLRHVSPRLPPGPPESENIISVYWFNRPPKLSFSIYNVMLYYPDGHAGHLMKPNGS